MSAKSGLKKQQQAASKKPQAKSKKGVHLSAGPSPAWRDRDFVRLCGLPATIGIVLSSRFSVLSCAPRNLSAVTVASLMLQRVTAFPLHLGTVWSLWTGFFQPGTQQGRRDRTLFVPCICQPSAASCRSRVAAFPPPLCTVWSVWTVCLEGQRQAASNKPQAKSKKAGAFCLCACSPLMACCLLLGAA